MRKYRALLHQIADEYAIRRGNFEREESWKARVIYTVCGHMTYAAAWDGLIEEDRTVSLEHIKTRIASVCFSYMEMYPELTSLFPDDMEALFKEIYDLYLKTGVLYHSSRRVRPAIKREALAESVLFLRGMPLGESVYMSGLGAYRTCVTLADSTYGVVDMFQLAENTLDERWGKLSDSIVWHPMEPMGQLEYLRMREPFSEGYWQSRPERGGCISLLRWGFVGNRRYALYKMEGKELFVSPSLPEWCVRDGAYLGLANACLHHYHRLPPIRCRYDGDIVYVYQKYLLPPPERNFLKLYSWPQTYRSLLKDFERVCSCSVFAPLRSVLEAQGYMFEEE